MGLFVALSSVFLGIGGGILLVPLLPTLFDIPVHQAVGTSVLTIFLVVSTNTWAFHRQNIVQWSLVWLMGPASSIAAFFAAQFAQRVDSQWILLTLSGLLVVVVIRSLVSSLLSKDYVVQMPLSSRQKVVAASGGIVAGLASGFAGVGSGAILSPLMIMLKVIEPRKLSPTANGNMVFTTAAASFSFFVSGMASGQPQGWKQWGLMRLDIAAGIFVVAFFLSRLLRPLQNRLPFRAKSTILNLLLCFLIVKVVYMFFSGR